MHDRSPDDPRDDFRDADDLGADDARHPERALAADHAFGLLDDDDERLAYERHLAGCAACRAEVDAYAETAALLAAALPAAEPPPGLRARVLAEARAAGARGGMSADATSFAPGDASGDAPDARVNAGASGPRLVRDDAPGRAAARPAAPPAARGGGARGARTPWLAAAASLALAAGLGAGWAGERAARRRVELALGTRADRPTASARAEYDGAVDGLRGHYQGEIARLRAVLAGRDSLVAALAEPGVRTARLTAAGEPEGMRLTWNRRRGLVAVTAAGLAPPGPGRVYQLWGLTRGGRPQSLGVFRPDAGGDVRAVLPVPVDAAMELAAVTVEPAGGSDAPTGAPVMTGEIGAE
jgi:anti-sigma-K factor RskA